MSLAILNEDKEIPEEYRELVANTWRGALAAIGVQQTYGQAELRSFYTALGTRLHPGEEPNTHETVRAALNDCGLDPEIADRAETDEWVDALRESHQQALDLVGDDVGTPVIRYQGMGIFGPVFSPAPKGDEAGRVFDGLTGLMGYSGFFELKRTRDRGPQFD